MKSWYKIQNKGNECLDVSLHDEIGLWGVSASDFISDLRANKNAKSINLSIHSPGGNMLDGFAIYNALNSHNAKVFAKVEGIAASAASMVLMAADVIEMPEDAFLMIHNPFGGAVGGSDDLREYADIMDKLKDSAVNIYVKKTGLPHEEISEMMSAETWLNSNESLEKGFIDTISNAVDVAAKAVVFNKYFKAMPITSNDNIEDIESIKDFERFLRDSGGLSRATATKLASRAKVIFQSESEQLPEADYTELEAALMRFKVPESLN